MSRIQQVFENRNAPVLNMYCTAGFPRLNSTREVMRALQDNGADLIELGMPYSDPLADGPVIQRSSAKALQNGMTITTLFEQLEGFREEITVPVVLMGYLNPLLQFGFEAFCARAAAVGIDGLIIPDIPVGAFEKEYGPLIRKAGLDFIFLVTPETPEDRVRRLDAASSGFLYAVSSSSVTGSQQRFAAVEEYLLRLKALQLRNPVLVGFGVRDRESFAAASRHTAGAIIGTAYIEALERAKDIAATTKEFIGTIREEGERRTGLEPAAFSLGN
jgi:tryptophan synthase alpha chain